MLVAPDRVRTTAPTVPIAMNAAPWLTLTVHGEPPPLPTTIPATRRTTPRSHSPQAALPGAVLVDARRRSAHDRVGDAVVRGQVAQSGHPEDVLLAPHDRPAQLVQGVVRPDQHLDVRPRAAVDRHPGEGDPAGE